MWEFLGLLVVTYFTGTWVERRHFRSIKERESKSAPIPIVASSPREFARPVRSLRLVSGCAVVGADFFKAKLATLVSIFGGNIASLESVMERARREAILRMRAEAEGADLICGVQFETCFLNDNKDARTVPVVEILVCGSAVYFENSDVPPRTQY